MARTNVSTLQSIDPAVKILGTLSDSATATGLIGEIYDAALDPAMWTHVIGKIAAFVGGQAGRIYLKDVDRKFASRYFCFGMSPEHMESYLKTYFRFDPMIGFFMCDMKNIASYGDIVSYDEFYEGRFFREWMQPQGWIDAAKTILEKSASCHACISILRGTTDGLVDDEMRRRMTMIVPHIRRSLLIGKTIELKQAEAESLAETLNSLSAALFLIDAKGRIVHTNDAARGILDANDFLRTIGGQLVARERHVDQALRQVFACADKGDAAVGIQGIALPLVDHVGERYVAHVLPLTGGMRRRAGAAYTAVAAMFVRKASIETPLASAIIGRTYGLTPAELRVLLALVDVGGIREVAEELGVASNTIKTHVSRLFEKTGASRQVDLVKLVAGFSTPLLS
jgi:DNA-binding CsgD family transcriptional regulator/PAS domain-containing protein